MIGDRLIAIGDVIGYKALDILARSGVSPNQLTGIGLILVLGNCGLYLVHKNTLFFGVGLALSYGVDGLDGALARRLGRTTNFGGYLDAVVDRYQEITSYLVLGIVNGWWLPIFLLTTGAMMVSYNKAAVAIEIPIEDKAWPDLLERQRRVALFCAALVFDQAIPVPAAIGDDLLIIALYCLAALTHFTALQRFLRARHILLRSDAARLAASAERAGKQLE
jgi:phosphatidylglycerophosphate synthase